MQDMARWKDYILVIAAVLLALTVLLQIRADQCNDELFEMYMDANTLLFSHTDMALDRTFKHTLATEYFVMELLNISHDEDLP